MTLPNRQSIMFNSRYGAFSEFNIERYFSFDETNRSDYLNGTLPYLTLANSLKISRIVDLPEEVLNKFKHSLYWNQITVSRRFTLDELIKYKDFLVLDNTNFQYNKSTPEKIKQDFLNYKELIK